MVCEDEKLIEVKIIRDNGDMKLYVKACSKFENYLKKTRKVTKKTKFCNTENTFSFYDGRTDGLSENVQNDSAIRDLIYNNRLNFAVLRIKGISNGIEIKLNRLLSIDDLNLMLRRFLLDFKNFYKDYIKGFEISCVLNYKDCIV